MNGRNVRNAQHSDQVFRHMPHGCCERHPVVSRRLINTTSHTTNSTRGPLIYQTPVTYKCKGKGKVHPITGHEGSEVEQRYSPTLSLISALDRIGWSTSRPCRFTPGKDPVPIV
jgi:hypothetical protein